MSERTVFLMSSECVTHRVFYIAMSFSRVIDNSLRVSYFVRSRYCFYCFFWCVCLSV